MTKPARPYAVLVEALIRNRITTWSGLIVTTILEHDTRKYQEFIAEHYYECKARVASPKAMNRWCTTLHYGSIYR